MCTIHSSKKRKKKKKKKEKTPKKRNKKEKREIREEKEESSIVHELYIGNYCQHKKKDVCPQIVGTTTYYIPTYAMHNNTALLLLFCHRVVLAAVL